MDPVSSDLLGWVAQELSLVLIEDDDGGRARLISGPDGAASTLEETPASLPDACRRLVGPALDASAVQELVEAARAGTRGSLALREGDSQLGTVLAWPVGPGRARVLHVPSAVDGSIARRAAAADLAAGVTHEVANALTAIAGWTRMAASSQPLPERTRQALNVVQRSAREALGTARGLLRTMRDTGSPSIEASTPEAVRVSEVVEQVLDTLRPELEEAQITLESELPVDIWSTTSPATLRLIVSNLVRNAYEALDGGGRIRVAARRRGDRFVLTVSDDGPGMSRETLSQAFDRYFTTKQTGTGLGLALVRDTVEEAGGRVEVQSRRGVGTRFDVWLPLAGAAKLSMRPPAVSTASSGVHPKPFLLEKRLLVVDDDEAIRTMVRTALELQGAIVELAPDRESALAKQTEFDVILVDLALGDARGDALIDELRAAGTDAQMILMSGSADLPPAAEGGPDLVLRKPFELEDLHRVLESVLSETPLEAEG